MADLPPLIPALVGGISGEQIRFVDSFVGRRTALFIPSVGPCLYATTPDHSHPGWSFALAADDRCRISANGRIIAPAPGTVLVIPFFRFSGWPAPRRRSGRWPRTSRRRASWSWADLWVEGNQGDPLRLFDPLTVRPSRDTGPG